MLAHATSLQQEVAEARVDAANATIIDSVLILPISEGGVDTGGGSNTDSKPCNQSQREQRYPSRHDTDDRTALAERSI